MGAQLIRTHLSEKPRKQSLEASLLGLAALMLVFVIDRQDLFGLSRLLSANAAQVFQHHEYWRLFTTTFIHADLGHLSSNAVFFTGLAFLLHGYYGGWAFPVASFLAGGVINLLTLLAYPPEVTLVGASGVVYFMASFWLTLYLFIDRRHSVSRRLMNATAFSLILLVPDAAKQEVSYLAHAIGFGLGIPVGGFFFLIQRSKFRGREVWKEVEPDLEAEAEPNCA